MSAVPTSALRDVATIERDIVDPADIRAGTLYVGLENIESGGRLVEVRPVRSGELASSKFTFTSSHVLYGKLRPYLAKIARPGFEGICSTDILPIRPGPKLDRAYLAWLLLSPSMVSRAALQATGANLPRLSPGVLEELRIPLPSLSEQRRIGEILDKVDALRAKRRVAIARLDFLARSIFLEMFGDPLANSRDWPLRKLKELGAIERGVSKHRPRNAPELLGGPYPFIQTGDIAHCNGYVRNFVATYSEAGLRQSKMWRAGVLCITIAANIAKTGILTFDACFPDSVVGFNSEEAATVEYVRGWMSFLQSTLEERAPESAQKNINLEILRNLEVPVPSVNLQRDFARRISAVENLKMSYQSSQAKIEILSASTSERAFCGAL